jgi:hypothetical protein
MADPSSSIAEVETIIQGRLVTTTEARAAEVRQREIARDSRLTASADHRGTVGNRQEEGHWNARSVVTQE